MLIVNCPPDDHISSFLANTRVKRHCHAWPVPSVSKLSVIRVCFEVISVCSSLQQQYAKEFSTFKPDKKLRWLPHLGTVNLELELQDRTVDVDVPPLEAAFIELFSEKSLSYFFSLSHLRLD
jgi:hypothetical protein